MSMLKGIKLCASIFRQFGLQRLAMGVTQFRNYRADEPSDWQMSKNYEDGSFDPRVDTRLYKIHENEIAIDGIKKGVREIESRRRITQDTVEHQRRQARIIEDNRRKWENRAEPKSPGVLLYERQALNRKERQKTEEEKLAEEYSRKRRQVRQAEKERQERELEESRRGYNLPKPDDSESPTAWLERKNQEDEDKYWHTWSTCPEERATRTEERAADEQHQNTDDGSFGFKSDERRGFIKPTRPYDNIVRRFQTHSRQMRESSTPYMVADLLKAPDDHQYQTQDNRYLDLQGWEGIIANNPRSSGMQYNLAQNKPGNRQTSVLDSLDFPKSSRCESDEQVEQMDEDLPEQFPTTKLSWQGLSPVDIKRFDDNRAATQKNEGKGKAKRCVEPPRFNMTIRSGSAIRRRPPIESFSSMLAVNTHFTPYSEYTGYSRQTVCDTWKNFKHIHNLKPIN